MAVSTDTLMPDKETEPEVKVRSAMKTDVGMVREHNEDSAYVDAKSRFFVVADGMGGHAAGEVASAMAVEGIRKALTESDERLQKYAANPSEDGRQEIAQVLEEAVRDAHRAVFERGVAEPDKQGMGTTLDVVLLCGQEAFVAHVGDSRTYLLRGKKAAQITTDHTVAEVLVIEGKLSAEEALVSPLRTILVNALGVSAEVGVEMAHLTLHKGDRLLMCSDGLHDYFPQEQELYDEVIANDPEVALGKLIDAAKERGGHDNITGVIVEVLDAPYVEEMATMPSPIIRATSDGIPHAIGKDDTMPVDAQANTPPQSAADDAEPESSQQAPFDENDYRSTVPIRVTKPVPKMSRAQTEDGVGETRKFAGEPTVELPSKSDRSSSDSDASDRSSSDSDASDKD